MNTCTCPLTHLLHVYHTPFITLLYHIPFWNTTVFFICQRGQNKTFWSLKLIIKLMTPGEQSNDVIFIISQHTLYIAVSHSVPKLYDRQEFIISSHQSKLLQNIFLLFNNNLRISKTVLFLRWFILNVWKLLIKLFNAIQIYNKNNNTWRKSVSHPISTLDQYQLSGLRLSGWYWSLGRVDMVLNMIFIRLTTRWIKFISNPKPWDILYLSYNSLFKCDFDQFEAKLHSY